jgi:hydroxymethylbilane synthase
MHLSSPKFPHAVGQGALAIEIRAGDETVRRIIEAVDDKASRWMCLAERSLLRRLQGGCSSPVAVDTVFEADASSVGIHGQGGKVTLYGAIIHPQGTAEVHTTVSSRVTNDDDAEALGILAAEKLESSGGQELLRQIKALVALG